MSNQEQFFTLKTLKSMSDEIKDLPNEIWLNILKFLPPRTLFNCEQSCKGMKQLISKKMKIQSRIKTFNYPDVWNVRLSWDQCVIHTHKHEDRTYMRYINIFPLFSPEIGALSYAHGCAQKYVRGRRTNSHL